MSSAVTSKKALRERCRTTESELVSSGKYKSAEFDALRPKGRGARSAGPWLVYLLNLTRMAGAVRVDPVAVLSPEVERTLVDAMRNQPEMVELVTPLTRDPDEEPIRHLAIHQKSLTALIEMHYWDAELAKLGPYAIWLRESKAARDLELLGAVLNRISYAQRILVWIVTEGREGNTTMCPYPKDVVEPVPPAYLEGLDVVDVNRILQAYLRVNYYRLNNLATLTKLVATSAPELARRDRASWSLFAHQQGEAMNRSAEEIMDRWSMMSVVARAALKVKEHYEMEERIQQEKRMRVAGA